MPAARVYDEQMKKYLQLAKKLNMEDAILITPRQVCFDKRVMLKCRWGCDSNGNDSLKCSARGTTFDERVEIIRCYKRILFLHTHNARELTWAALEIERAAFRTDIILPVPYAAATSVKIALWSKAKNALSPKKYAPAINCSASTCTKPPANWAFPARS